MNWFTEEVCWFQNEYGKDEAYEIACNWLQNDSQFDPVLCAGYYPNSDYIWFIQANDADFYFFAGYFDPYSAKSESEFVNEGLDTVERVGVNSLEEARDYLNF